MSPNSTFCNTPWKNFFDRAGISSKEVWLGVVSQHTHSWNMLCYVSLVLFHAVTISDVFQSRRVLALE